MASPPYWKVYCQMLQALKDVFAKSKEGSHEERTALAPLRNLITDAIWHGEHRLSDVLDVRSEIAHLTTCLEYAELEIGDWEEAHEYKMQKREGDPR